MASQRSTKRAVPGRPRKQDKTDRPRRILEAAVKLYARHGFEQVHHKHIAEEAGVAASLISHHFGDRASFRAACNRFVLDEMHQVLDEVTAALDDFSTSAAFDTWLSSLSPSRVDILRCLALLFIQDDGANDFFREYFARFHQITLSLIDRGLIREDIDPVWATLTRVYAQLGTAFLYQQVEDIIGADPYAPEPTRQRVDTIMKIFRDGALKPN